MPSGFIKSRVAAGAIAPWSIAAFTGNRNEVAQAAGSSAGLAGITNYLGIDALCSDRMVDLQPTEVADVKAAGVEVFHDDELESLKAHILAFVTAYNFAKHLKALRWKTPFQTMCQAWTKNSDRFRINPHHLIPGPYT